MHEHARAHTHRRRRADTHKKRAEECGRVCGRAGGLGALRPELLTLYPTPYTLNMVMSAREGVEVQQRQEGSAG